MLSHHPQLSYGLVSFNRPRSKIYKTIHLPSSPRHVNHFQLTSTTRDTRTAVGAFTTISLSKPNWLLSTLSVVFAASSVISPCASADFDAKTAFAWVDSSCNAKIDRVNTAGKEYGQLVDSALKSLGARVHPKTELDKAYLASYFGSPFSVGPKSKSARSQNRSHRTKMSPRRFSQTSGSIRLDIGVP